MRELATVRHDWLHWLDYYYLLFSTVVVSERARADALFLVVECVLAFR